MADVFISYSGNEGGKIANALKKGLLLLAARGGLREDDIGVFIDNTIMPGEVGHNVICQNLRGCRWFVFVVTKESNESQCAQQELGAAMALRKHVFPVLGKDMNPDDLPCFAKKLQAVPVGAIDNIALMMSAIIQDKQAALRNAESVALRRRARSVGKKAEEGKQPPPDDALLKLLKEVLG